MYVLAVKNRVPFFTYIPTRVGSWQLDFQHLELCTLNQKPSPGRDLRITIIARALRLQQILGHLLPKWEQTKISILQRS